MEPGFLVVQACRCDSHLLYRLVGDNVRILRVNLTLLCWCRVSDVHFWLIFPDMLTLLIRNIARAEYKCGQNIEKEHVVRVNKGHTLVYRPTVFLRPNPSVSEP